ncbi:MAG: hypothetical protein ACREBG_19915, partial [Pyrinomonadaceae bacterium]
MKKIFARAVIALFIFTLIPPGFVFSQQRQQRQPSIGDTSSGRPPTGVLVPGKRSSRATPGNTIPLIERDVDEALELIQDNHVEGKKLDYNTVFKSSIIGMLRALDPHSNYYDRDEFDELKT